MKMRINYKDLFFLKKTFIISAKVRGYEERK